VDRHREFAGTASCGDFNRRGPPDENGTLSRKAFTCSGLSAQALEQIPLVPGADVHCLTKRLHLRRSHQPGVIVLVAGDRQPKPFTV